MGQLQKLKTYLAKADNLRRPKTSVFGAGRIKSHTGSRLPRRKKQRPSRNLHTEAALPMSPRSRRARWKAETSVCGGLAGRFCDILHQRGELHFGFAQACQVKLLRAACHVSTRA